MHAMFAFAVAAALLLPVLAHAQQDQPQARVGNVWNNASHQPTQSEVSQQEKAAGVALRRDQQRQTADELQELDRQVMQRALQGTNDGVLNGTAALRPLPP
jgi:hypothetical protein